MLDFFLFYRMSFGDIKMFFSVKAKEKMGDGMVF